MGVLIRSVCEKKSPWAVVKIEEHVVIFTVIYDDTFQICLLFMDSLLFLVGKRFCS